MVLPATNKQICVQTIYVKRSRRPLRVDSACTAVIALVAFIALVALIVVLHSWLSSVPHSSMFKKFKDKLAEEMKQSPARLQASVQQLAQVQFFTFSFRFRRLQMTKKYKKKKQRNANAFAISRSFIVTCRQWCRQPCPAVPFKRRPRPMTISV